MADFVRDPNRRHRVGFQYPVDKHLAGDRLLREEGAECTIAAGKDIFDLVEQHQGIGLLQKTLRLLHALAR